MFLNSSYPQAEIMLRIAFRMGRIRQRMNAGYDYKLGQERRGKEGWRREEFSWVCGL